MKFALNEGESPEEGRRRMYRRLFGILWVSFYKYNYYICVWLSPDTSRRLHGIEWCANCTGEPSRIFYCCNICLLVEIVSQETFWLLICAIYISFIIKVNHKSILNRDVVVLAPNIIMWMANIWHRSPVSCINRKFYCF